MAATLTPAATTGLDVIFTASEEVFLEGDVGRQIIYQASRAIIKTFTSTSVVHAEILDAFPSTAAIPARSWFLRLSPQTTLDPDKKAPVGTTVTLVAGVNAFRNNDVGKFIVIYGGVVKITTVSSRTQVVGELMSLMSVTADDPPAAPAGSWTLEVEAWSAINGFPRTIEFHQGRLALASTRQQPTTFWLSTSDDYDNFAVGVAADDAIEYTIASQKINRIEWMAAQISLFLGTTGAEFKIDGLKDEPLGGNAVPNVVRITTEGSAGIQPAIISKRLLFVDRSRRKIFAVAFSLEEDGFDVEEVTKLSEHITAPGLTLGPIAFALRPDPRLFYIRDDGQLVTLTFFIAEKVVGFTRLETAGAFESVAVNPRPGGDADEVWVVVRRVINGRTKRYIERFDDVGVPAGASWPGLQMDSTVSYDGSGDPGLGPTTFIRAPHLREQTVDIFADGAFRGTGVAVGPVGAVGLPEEFLKVDVGLHYDSVGVTMRPAIQGSMIEGLPRAWISVFVRLLDTIGGTLNGQRLQYPPSPLDTIGRFTGDRKVTGINWDDNDGRITITQDQPYPMTVLALFGSLEIGDHD